MPPPHTPPDVADPFEPAFTRGQVELALWRQEFANRRRTPTTKFKIKVKHLLELDRDERLAPRTTGCAFSDEHSSGSGEHALFSVFDAFMLAIAVHLLEIGFKRKEVILFLSARRGAWRRIGPILKQRLKSAAAELAKSHERRTVTDYKAVVLQIPAIDAPLANGDDNLRLGELGDLFTAEHPRLIMLNVGFAAHHLPWLLLTIPKRKRGPS